MRVSLIITTYNWPESLELVLRSIECQTITPEEVIIADDGSTPETKALVSRFIQDSGLNIVYSWQEDKGFFESEADENGKTWIKGIDSSVPGFWLNCPKIRGANSKGYDIVCATPHFVFIYQDGEKLTCRKCNKESTIKLVLPKE